MHVKVEITFQTSLDLTTTEARKEIERAVCGYGPDEMGIDQTCFLEVHVLEVEVGKKMF